MLIRLSFHVRATLPFVSIALEPLEGRERTSTSRIDHRKTRSNFFKNPFEFLPRVAPVSFDYREKTSSPPPSLIFLSLRHTAASFRRIFLPSLSSLFLLPTSSFFLFLFFFFFFLHIVIAQTRPSLTPFVAHQCREFRGIALP